MVDYKYMVKSGLKKNNRAFTIVELLVVIVIIGILAAVTIVSYSGISNKAIGAGLQSDLSIDAKILKMYNVEYGVYPSTFGSDFCPATPNVDTRYCLKASPDTTLTYIGGSQAFKLKAKKSGQTYYITEGDIAKAVTVPIVDYNTATSMTSTTATIGATIVSDGGDDITGYGMCYGTAPNPTYCVEAEQGMLVSTSPTKVATSGTPQRIVTSADGKNIYTMSSSGSISMFSRNSATGILNALSPASIATGDAQGMDIVISPDGKNAYAVSTTSSSAFRIYLFNRDESTGKLTAHATPNMDLSAGIIRASIAISSDGKHVYVFDSSNKIRLLTRNESTGLLTIGATVNSGISSGGITTSPDGNYIYTTSTSGSNGAIFMYSRNLSNGTLTSLTPSTYDLGNSVGCDSMGISNDNKHMYVNCPSNNRIMMFSRNISNGQIAALSPSYIAANAQNYGGVRVSPDGKNVYQSGSSSYIRMFSRDANSGLLNALTTPSIFSNQTKDIIITPDGKSIYSANNSDGAYMYNRTVGTTEGTVFTKAISGLTANTTYYYRGYATNSIGTGYSADSTFTTNP